MLGKNGIALVALLMTTAIPPTYAADAKPDNTDCANITDSTKRLACFDKAAGVKSDEKSTSATLGFCASSGVTLERLEKLAQEEQYFTYRDVDDSYQDTPHDSGHTFFRSMTKIMKVKAPEGEPELPAFEAETFPLGKFCIDRHNENKKNFDATKAL